MAFARVDCSTHTMPWSIIKLGQLFFYFNGFPFRHRFFFWDTTN